MSRIAPALALAAAAFGLWTSFRYTLTSWFVDADAANLAMLWQGLHQYGWGFLRSFAYTQDNWLLSLVLPQFAVFSIIGPSPTWVVASGWLIFVGCAGLCALLAYRLAGLRAAAIVLPVVLLCTQTAIGQTGASYTQPATHNSSMLWGLLALSLAARWLDRGGWLALAATAAAVFIPSVSDPWADAAFALPILLAALGTAAFTRNARWRSAALAALAAAALGLAMTRALGMLAFLPASDPSWRSLAAIPDGVRLFFALLPALFTIAPLDPATGAAELATATLVALALAAGLWSWGRSARTLSAAQRFIVAAGYLSLAGTAATFCLSAFAVGPTVGRFIMNWGLLLPMLTASACLLGGLGRILPGALAAGAVAMVAAGVTSAPAAWQVASVRPPLDGFRHVAALLADHGLRYGYGDYWGSMPTAITWVSGGAVRVRPLRIDTDTGAASPWPFQSSPLWFQAPDRQPGERRTFIILWNDCRARAACVQGLTQQFGPPADTITDGTITVLVWSAPLSLAPPNS